MSRAFCETWGLPPKTSALLIPQHHLTQRPINPSLVPSPLGFEPGDHIGIQPQRNRPLDRPVHLRHFRRSPQLLGRGSDSGNFPTLRTFRASLRFHGHTSIVHTFAAVQNVPRGTLCQFAGALIASARFSDVTMPLRPSRMLGASSMPEFCDVALAGATGHRFHLQHSQRDAPGGRRTCARALSSTAHVGGGHRSCMTASQMWPRKTSSACSTPHPCSMSS